MANAPAVVLPSSPPNRLHKHDNSNPQQGSEGLRTPSPPGEAETQQNTVGEEKPIQCNTATFAPTGGAGSGGASKTSAAGTCPGDTAINSAAATCTGRTPPTKKDCRKLFVGGLPSDVTEDEFREFFEQFGEIVDSVVMFDRETQRSRGFGFVTYKDAEVANRLLGMGQEEQPKSGEGAPINALAADGGAGPRIGRLVMRGKTCEVKAAEPKEATKPPTRRVYHNQGNATGGASGSVGTPGRRFSDNVNTKTYSPVNRPPDTLHDAVMASGGHYDPHYLTAPAAQYPMYAPGYYPSYHHGMYGVGAYNPAMYAPMGADTSQQYQENPGMYLDPHNSHDGYSNVVHGHHYAPHMMYHHASYQQPQYPASLYSPNPKIQMHYQINNSFAASVMQPVAPGLPTKDGCA